MTDNNNMNNNLDFTIRPHRKRAYDSNAFNNPIIHKRIDGSVIVPLNIKRIWEE